VAAQDSYDQGSARVELDFDSIVDQFYAPLYRFAMSLSRAEDDAADLVQETFLTWAEKGHQLREPAKIKSWLFPTLHRLFLAGQRRVARFPHLELEEAKDELPTVEADIGASIDAQRAAGLLASVDPQYRAALALFYLEDYSYPEIAALLEIPLGTVKSRLARGLGQLKALASHPSSVASSVERPDE